MLYIFTKLNILKIINGQTLKTLTVIMSLHSSVEFRGLLEYNHLPLFCRPYFDFLIIKLLSRKQKNSSSIFAIWHKARRKGRQRW
jgi:hypothetical protein